MLPFFLGIPEFTENDCVIRIFLIFLFFDRNKKKIHCPREPQSYLGSTLIYILIDMQTQQTTQMTIRVLQTFTTFIYLFFNPRGQKY